MARETKRLSARSVATLSKPGRHSDGDGLYLVVDPSGAKRWLFRFRWKGKLKELGLGGIASTSLAQARDRSAEARSLIKSGASPIEAKRAVAAADKAATTFGAFADNLVQDLSHGFRNDKHRWQWRHTLEIYAAPLRSLALDAIQTDDVLAVLQPLWNTKQETASRLRGRIERVLDAAKAKGLRVGENPARWRGHLDQLLSRRQKLRRGHHPAMAYDAVPDFMGELREREAVAARALEFVILNASRTSEVLGARHSEVDRKARLWVVPAARMKTGVEHRVPLTARALEILDQMERAATSEFIFPGSRKGKPLSNMAMSRLLKVRMNKPGVTVHGFRSSFRDWAGEATAFPREVAEAALSHAVGDATERAYRRGDALEKRRKLLDAWAGFVAGGKPDGKIVPLRAYRNV